MVPSFKWQGHSPFKAEMLGSTPEGIIRASSESANATDCKSVLLGGNGLDTHLAHFNFILIGEKRHDTIIATPTEELTT